ncbi:cytochrome P450 [Actinomadura litoris]|uniref:cytochrome P450 n=1 Tax=Actinomadura litoris TaxID=2678616 RepID=UPI001FA6E37A|nr:cytochrome P450 [Actinomadura litoris]
MGELILTQRGERHRKIRNLVMDAFTSRAAEKHRPSVQALADEYVTAMLATEPPTDLITALTQQIPFEVITRLLGVPTKDGEEFRAWSDDIMAPAGEEHRALVAALAMLEYNKRLMAVRRDRPEDDLITTIAQRAPAIGVTEDDAGLLIIALLVGGWETTSSVAAGGVLRLLTTHHPSGPTVYRYLTQQPQHLPGAVAEIVRTVPTSWGKTGLPRLAIQDTVVDGHTIKKGEFAAAGHDAGNHDPTVFPDPDRFDIHRPNGVTDTLAFGGGAHYCIGVHLARIEIEGMIGALLRQVPDLELACDPAELEWDYTTTVHRTTALPVTWPPLPSGAPADR